MSEPRLSDVGRQFLNVFAAIFQVYAAYVAGDAVGAIARENRSLILPAGYAFSIWGPIFILCGAYALHQAMPAERENRRFRAIGWWTAAAFLANGAWTYAFTNRLFILAQAIIVVALVCALVAYLRFARMTPSAASRIDTAIIGPALGLLAGWLTAATVVGFPSTLVSQGFDATRRGAEIGGAALLLLGGGIAVAALLLSKSGLGAAWVAYGAAVLWALLAVIVEQRAASWLSAGAAALCALLIIAVMAGPWAVPVRRVHDPVRGRELA